jgi:hypothetical protein
MESAQKVVFFRKAAPQFTTFLIENEIAPPGR